MDRNRRIEKKLQHEFMPSFLRVTNNSHKHKGHPGAENSTPGESHYEIEILSVKLKDLSRLEAQQMVMDVLKDEFENGLHSVQLRVMAYV